MASLAEIDALYAAPAALPAGAPSVDEIDALYAPSLVSRAVETARTNLATTAPRRTGTPAAEALAPLIETATAPAMGVESLLRGPIDLRRFGVPVNVGEAEPGSFRSLLAKGVGGIERGLGFLSAPFVGAGRLTEQALEQAPRLVGQAPTSTAVSRFAGEYVPIVAPVVPAMRAPAPFEPVPQTPTPPSRLDAEAVYTDARRAAVARKTAADAEAARQAWEATRQRMDADLAALMARREARGPAAATPEPTPITAEPPTPLPSTEIPSAAMKAGAVTPSRLVDAQGRPIGPVEVPRTVEAPPETPTPEGRLRSAAEIAAEKTGVARPSIEELDALYAAAPERIGQEAEQAITEALREGVPETAVPTPAVEPPPAAPAAEVLPPLPTIPRPAPRARPVAPPTRVAPPPAAPLPREATATAIPAAAAPPAEPPLAPVRFLGWQERGGGEAPIPLFNLTAPVGGRPIGDTVGPKALLEAGYRLPKIEEPPPPPRAPAAAAPARPTPPPETPPAAALPAETPPAAATPPEWRKMPPIEGHEAPTPESSLFDERGFVRLTGRQKVETPAGTGLAEIDAMAAQRPTPKSWGQRARDVRQRLIETQTNKFEPARIIDEARKAAGQAPAKGEGVVEYLELAPNRTRGNILADRREVGRAYAQAFHAGLEDQLNQYLTLRQFERRIQQIADRPENAASPHATTWRRGIRPDGTYVNPRGFDLSKVQGELLRLEQRLTPAQWRTVQQAAQRVWAVNRRLLDEAHAAGIVSDPVYQSLTARGDAYVPIQVLDYLTEEGTAGGAGRGPGLRSQAVLKRMEGTERDVQNTLESTVDRIARVRTQIERNKAARAITDQPMPGLVERVPGDVFSVPQKDRTVISVFEGGERVNYAVPTPVARALSYLDGTQAGFLERLLGATAQPLKAGATGANVGFAITNHVRDLKRLLLFSRYGVGSPKDLVTLPLDYARGLFTAIHGGALGRANALYDEYLRSGAAFSTIQKNLTPETFLKASAGVESVAARANVLRWMVRAAQEFNSIIEETPKLTGLIRGQRSGESPAAVAYEVANYAGSPNFARAGALAREMNLLWMFYNARLQGTLANLRRAEEAPLATFAKIGAFTMAPGVALWLHNQQYAGDHGLEDVSENDRQKYWIILQPETYEASDGTIRRKYLKLAKEESEQVTWPLMEGALDWLVRHDPPSVTKLSTDVWSNLSPITFNVRGEPTAKTTLAALASGALSSLNPVARVPIELGFNYNAYSQAPIVSRGLEAGTLPSDQARATTSPTMIRLSRVLSDAAGIEVSPIKLEYAVTSATGGLGQSGLDLADQLQGKALPETVGEYERTARLPGFARVMGRSGDQANRDREERFYTVYDEAQRISGSLTAAGQGGPDTARFTQLTTDPAALAKVSTLDTLRDIAKELSTIRQAEVFITHHLEASKEDKLAALRSLQESRTSLLDAFQTLETMTRRFTVLPAGAGMPTAPPAAPAPVAVAATDTPEDDEEATPP